MTVMAIAICGLLLLNGRAQGLVGGAPLATGDIARSVVGIVGPHGFFCTATAIAHNIVLTAGHCARPGADYKVQYKDNNGLRAFFDIIDWERPPQFLIRSAPPPIADLALLKLATPLPADIGVAILELHQRPIWPGDRFTVIGGGVAIKGLHETGTNRVATLAATGPYSALQIRLVDSSGKPITMGACFGDSGSPVFETTDGAKVIGVVSWASSPTKSKGCGGTTGATLLSPYRQWIEETVIKLGGIPKNDAAPN
jgi:Trypsin